MWHRMVSDLMTAPVVRVRRDTGFKEIAKLLAEYDITAVPVVDDDEHPVGVVSEADLLRKEASHLDPAGLSPSPHLAPTSRTKAEAATAEGLMNSPVVTARPGWTAVEAAQVMERNHVKRLPVVDETGTLVGVISRADLLSVFLRGDSAIREEITGEVLLRTLGITPDGIDVRVVDGRVALKGTVERKSLVPVVVRLCQGVDGVVDVSADLRHRVDDIQAEPEPGASRRAGLAT
ncbi:CBS domain-containing protein [Streptomyces sp. NBC_00080]|uniref:CBS domain-containing protein n=1 Tax=Streptomyces TaxID=1883 RepID=UPI001153866B|nr:MULTISPECIES: CBS domain-containing protein [Streptomyces]TQJ57613.1 BON domain-containing protein [Streptomyces sp. SLBN-115]